MSKAFQSWLAILALALPGASAAAESSRPNVVLIYADDIGWGVFGCYGGKAATPNVDRLAKEGLRFTGAYASAATCTPSR